VNRLKLLQVFVILLFFIITLVISQFISYASDKYEKINDSWNEYTKTEKIILENLFSIYDNLGYGGLIHNFKNYVIRRESIYYTEFHENYASLVHSIDSLKGYLKTSKEIKDLNIIQETINEYSKKIKLVKKIDGTKHVKAVDAIVKIEDFSALKSLNNIAEDVYFRLNQAQQKTHYLMMQANKILTLGSLIIIPLLLFLILLIYFLRKSELFRLELVKSRDWVNTLLDTASRCNVMYK